MACGWALIANNHQTTTAAALFWPCTLRRNIVISFRLMPTAKKKNFLTCLFPLPKRISRIGCYRNGVGGWTALIRRRHQPFGFLHSSQFLLDVSFLEKFISIMAAQGSNVGLSQEEQGYAKLSMTGSFLWLHLYFVVPLWFVALCFS